MILKQIRKGSYIHLIWLIVVLLPIISWNDIQFQVALLAALIPSAILFSRKDRRELKLKLVNLTNKRGINYPDYTGNFHIVYTFRCYSHSDNIKLREIKYTDSEGKQTRPIIPLHENWHLGCVGVPLPIEFSYNPDSEIRSIIVTDTTERTWKALVAILPGEEPLQDGVSNDINRELFLEKLDKN